MQPDGIRTHDQNPYQNHVAAGIFSKLCNMGNKLGGIMLRIIMNLDIRLYMKQDRFEQYQWALGSIRS
jgi:hypothetical protein